MRRPFQRRQPAATTPPVEPIPTYTAYEVRNLLDTFQQLDLAGRHEAAYHHARLVGALGRMREFDIASAAFRMAFADAIDISFRLASAITSDPGFEFERRMAEVLYGDCDLLVDHTLDR